MENHEILIVDDDAPVRAVVRLALGRDNFSLREAPDGEAAWAAVNESPPDLVICDYSMPGIDGIELIRRIKSDPALSEVGALLLTGFNTMDIALEGLEAGADDFVAKPFDSEDLRIRVLGLVRKRYRNRERTQLPSGRSIPDELDRRIRSGEPFAAIFIALENFEPYLFKFGFRWSETVLYQVADIVRRAVLEEAPKGSFVGHIVAENFLAVCPPENARAACEALRPRFKQALSVFYDDKDLRRGFVVGVDRYGFPMRRPLLAVSAVIVDSTEHRLKKAEDLARIVEAARAKPSRDDSAAYVLA